MSKSKKPPAPLDPKDIRRFLEDGERKADLKGVNVLRVLSEVVQYGRRAAKGEATSLEVDAFWQRLYLVLTEVERDHRKLAASVDAMLPSPASEPSVPECPPAVRVDPKTLSISWPTYLGRRVSFACRAIRRIDLTRTVVVAGGERFVVIGSPNVTPCGGRSSAFTVVGSTVVAIAGRTALPELLEENGECPR